MEYKWKVAPLCDEQLLDIQPEDIVPGGVFRLCYVYKSGGGYDKFPQIYKKRTGRDVNSKQFVVQLYGCHLECPYCYVTPSGVWNYPKYYTSEQLVDEFMRTGLEVFHLMGGAPALYIEHWPELIDRLDNRGNFVFHSDITLTEKRFNRHLLGAIAQSNCLYAVNIKGVSEEDYKRNTGKDFDSSMFWLNLWDIKIAKVPFYITFTNPDLNELGNFVSWIKNNYFGSEILEDVFVIDIKEYNAVEAYNARHGN